MIVKQYSWGYLVTERPNNIVSRNLRKLARDARRRKDSLPRLDQKTEEISKFCIEFDVRDTKSVNLAIESRSNAPDESGAALVELRALDKTGARQTISGWGFISARVGEYHYLESQNDEAVALTQFKMNLPSNVAVLEVIGHSWKRAVKTEILGEVLFWEDGHGPLTEMQSGRSIAKSASLYCEQFEVPSGASHASFRLPLRGGKNDARVPFRFEFYKENEKLALPPANMPQHRTYGPIEIAATQANTTTIAQVRVPIPDKVASLKIAGVDWGENTPEVLNNASVNFEYENTHQIDAFLSELDQCDRLILVDTTAPPVGHTTLSLRPNNLAKAWANLGIKVIFLPFSTIQDQERIPHINILQLSRAEFEPVRNWLFENREGKKNTYVCSSFPSREAVGLIDSFNARGWNTVYECRDDMEEFNRVGYSKWYHPQLERRVVEQAKQVTAVSTSLANKLKSMSRKGIGVVVTPNGVISETIEGGLPLRTTAVAEARAESKTFGYVGHLTGAWFDWDLIIQAATKRPEYKFEIIGHGMPEYLELPSSISYLGPKSHSEIADLVSEWRAGLIPFLRSPLTRSVDPNKVYEYYAWGLPCISAEMGNVKEYPSAKVYRTQEQFIYALDRCVSRNLTSDELNILERFLEECSWTARAHQTSELFFR